ncbi:Interleukin-22 [Platysternon megacephalum]|uniref:Interleukin family protein n=1 Tax=Platysternon megacephalum TaxID=55544 RepID=A0A4D9ED44_9SAUR|nr:Interleukin-22 [Platysternon megacephalum]
MPPKGAQVAPASHACRLRKISFQQSYIRNRTYTLAKLARLSDQDTDNRLIGQQLYINVQETNRCYVMKRVIEIVVDEVLLSVPRNRYPHIHEVAQFLAALSTELSGCKFSGHREHVEKNLEEMKDKMKQLGVSGKNKAIGELDLLFDYMENACTEVPKRIVTSKKASSGKNSCRKGMISKVTENLYVKATTFKASIPKDLIKNRRLLKKTTKKLFMKNCSVRDQLLSFYVKNVFGGLGIGSDKVYIVSAFQTLQENLSSCLPCAPTTRVTTAVKKIKKMFDKLGEKGIYKAIGELDILLPWIQTYIETIK